MKSILSILFLLTGINVAEASPATDRYHQLMKVTDQIYNPKNNVRPTNNMLWFHGNQRWLTYYSGASINRADVLFGNMLMQTYDMYCRNKGKNINCLGGGLKVNYRISGRSKSGAKVISISTSGVGSFTAGYIIEAISKFYGQLETRGGQTPLKGFERRTIQPTPNVIARTDYHVTSNGNKNHANNKWLDRNFLRAVRDRIKANLRNRFTFWMGPIREIRNASDYNDKAQRSLLYKYSSLRKQGMVNVVVSGPATSDGMGYAWVGRNSSPYFVMRSLFNSKDPKSFYYERKPGAINHNSLIYIHELAHNMGLRHCSAGQKSFCTDNLHHNNAGADYVKNYMSSIGALRYKYAY